jgi:hypothetical protein
MNMRVEELGQTTDSFLQTSWSSIFGKGSSGQFRYQKPRRISLPVLAINRVSTDGGQNAQWTVHNSNAIIRHSQTYNRFMKLCVSVSLLLALVLCVPAVSQSVRLADSSDWWSISSENFHAPDLKPQNKEMEASNFEVLGLRSGAEGFGHVTAKLGKAVIVERGDASTGRQQACYVSSRGRPDTHLIFEFGEDTSIIYLFADGPDWKGSRYCVRSSKVSSSLGTASGLRLGLTPNAVEAILGHPDAVMGETVVYFRQFQKKTTPKEFDEFRREYPEALSDAQAHQKFDYYPIEQYIVVKFMNARLTYLAAEQ